MIEALIAIVLALVFLVLLPLALLYLLFKLALGLLLLPFKIAAWILKGLVGVVGAVAGVIGALLAGLVGLGVAVGAIVLLGFLPLILIVGIGWLIYRIARPRPVAQPVV